MAMQQFTKPLLQHMPFGLTHTTQTHTCTHARVIIYTRSSSGRQTLIHTGNKQILPAYSTHRCFICGLIICLRLRAYAFVRIVENLANPTKIKMNKKVKKTKSKKTKKAKRKLKRTKAKKHIQRTTTFRPRKTHWGEFVDLKAPKVEVRDCHTIYPPEKKHRLERLLPSKKQLSDLRLV